MKISFTTNFRKSYHKRIALNPRLAKKTKSKILLFSKDPFLAILKNHSLKGNKIGLKAFAVTRNIRIIYWQKSSEEAVFLDIGSHNQVY